MTKTLNKDEFESKFSDDFENPRTQKYKKWVI